MSVTSLRRRAGIGRRSTSASGNRPPTCLPLARAASASERFFAGAQPIELNYGRETGRCTISQRRSRVPRRCGWRSRRPKSLLLTAGISQALDFVCSRLTRPGDTVFVEEPTYFLFASRSSATTVSTSSACRWTGRAWTSSARARDRTAPPETPVHDPGYNNPTGQTLEPGAARAPRRLSRKHDFIIAADEVYQLLHYGTPPPPSLGTLGRAAATCCRWARSRRSSRPACGSAGSRRMRH